MNPLIAATGLRAGYATGDVLQEVSIEVGTGEIVGVLGPQRRGQDHADARPHRSLIGAERLHCSIAAGT